MGNINRQLHKIDADGKAAGRLASEIAILLRGKNKPEFAPNIDGGDIVEVVNISKLKFTGKKLDNKKYYSYSGYPGGLKEKKMRDVFKADPGEVLKRAIRKMLPAVKFRNDMLKRLIIK
ncbi:50S ribosomal protein L13 [Candidatus Parcubacteria bacterium]|nr:50S ribosomal protein L13 [Candidatus Parcubacteria bacterium]